MERYDLVQRAYSELESSGDVKPIPPGTNQGKLIEEQKAYVTRRAAYYLNTLHNSVYGLLSKTSGNNVKGLSVDIVVRHDNGDYYDVVTDVKLDGDFRVAKTINASRKNDPNMIAKWVKPTKELAGIDDSVPPPPPPPPPDNSDEEILAKLNEINDKLDMILAVENALVIKAEELLAQLPKEFPTYKGSIFGINITLRPE